MSIIECRSCGGRFRLAANPQQGKLACPRCGVAMRPHTSVRATTKSQPTANVVTEGGLRVSGVVTRKNAVSKPLIVATICVLIVALGAVVAMRL